MVASLGVTGCTKKKADPPPPPPVVEAITVRARELPNIIELPGRIEAVRTAEVRARVDGVVERRLYIEGRDIKAGMPLFLIDPREKRAALQQAVAALQRQHATGIAAADFSRIRNVNLGRFTIDRLISILGRLDREVEVSVSVRARPQAAQLAASLA